MAQVTRNLPAGQEPTPDMRSGVARQALQQLITQAALNQELQRLRIVTPDQAVRQTVFTMPAFRGPNGQFDRQTFETLLRNNGLTEARFLDMMRGDLAQRQLLGAVSAGAATPEVLLRPLYQSQFEKRAADMVEFPLAAAPEPPPRPRPSCSAGTTTIPISIPRRNTAGSRLSCCHRRHWRRTSRSATPTSRQLTSSARRST